MEPGKAKRIRIYVNEDDQIGHRPAHLAVIELLRRERVAGATVVRGFEGFGGSGVVHTVNLGDLVEKLPIVIEWIDTHRAPAPQARANAPAGPRDARRYRDRRRQAGRPDRLMQLAEADRRAHLLGDACEGE
jgi:PII-like signaling protein